MKEQNDVIAMLDDLNAIGTKDCEIAKKCGVSPSQVNGWRNKQTPKQPSLNMLQALSNRRLKTKEGARTFNVVKGIKFALVENWQETFLVEAVSVVLSGKSLSHQQSARLSSVRTFDELNQIINEDFECFVAEEIDKELKHKGAEKFSLRYNSFSHSEWFILPSHYQKKASQLLDDLSRYIEEAELHYQKQQERKEQERKYLESRVESAFNKSVQQYCHMRDDLESVLNEVRNEVLATSDSIIQDLKLGSIYNYPLLNLLKAMGLVSTYVYESKYGGFNALPHSHQIELYGREIALPDDVVIFDDYESVIADAKSLSEEMKKFVEWQHEKYGEIKQAVSTRLKLSKTLPVVKLFTQTNCNNLVSGDLIDACKPVDLDCVAESLINRNYRKLTLVFADEKHEIDVVALLSAWFENTAQEVVLKRVQLANNIVYPSVYEDEAPFCVFRISGQDTLVTFEQREILGGDYYVMNKSLSAFEVTEGICDDNLRASVKTALLEHGYVFSDVEVID